MPIRQSHVDKEPDGFCSGPAVVGGVIIDEREAFVSQSDVDWLPDLGAACWTHKNRRYCLFEWFVNTHPCGTIASASDRHPTQGLASCFTHAAACRRIDSNCSQQ